MTRAGRKTDAATTLLMVLLILTAVKLLLERLLALMLPHDLHQNTRLLLSMAQEALLIGLPALLMRRGRSARTGTMRLSIGLLLCAAVLGLAMRAGNAADAAVGQFRFRAGAPNCGGGQRRRMVLAAAGAGGSSGSAGGSAVPRRRAANAAGQRQPIWRMAADDAVLFAPARQSGGTPGASALRRCADARGNADGESACSDGNARCLQCIRTLLARHVLLVADFCGAAVLALGIWALMTLPRTAKMRMKRGHIMLSAAILLLMAVQYLL